LFNCELGDDSLKVIYTADDSSVQIPYTPLKADMVNVTIWDDTCAGQLVSDEADNWFSQKLGLNCRLVYMPDDTQRQTDIRYTELGTVTSFSDAYPALMIGQAALDDLNSRLADALPMNRFRPNIVFTGGRPYSEDTMKHIRINGIDMFGVKLCARCVMTTIDQHTTQKSKEPLKTLATYRRKGAKILFGQNMVHGKGIISVGDVIDVLALHTEERFVIDAVV